MKVEAPAAPAPVASAPETVSAAPEKVAVVEAAPAATSASAAVPAAGSYEKHEVDDPREPVVRSADAEGPPPRRPCRPRRHRQPPPRTRRAS